MTKIFITKRDGDKEEYSADKIHEKTLWACEGLSGVSASDIEMNASLHIVDGTPSENIQKALISSASELISTEAPNYEYVTSRLLNQQFRKEVYGQFEPLPFYEEVVKRCEAGIYDPAILDKYSKEEIEFFGSKLDFSRDDSFTYTGLQQIYSKYSITRDGKVIETPQEIFMLMNMYVFSEYNPEMRTKWILEGYKCLSTFEVSLPTPQMNGLRTTFKRFISCNLIEAGDTTKSLGLANAFIMMMTANKSGLGLGVGDIRGLDADIDGGRVGHTGILPIIKAYEKSTKAFTQVQRGGSSTNFYPFFHYEAELIMQLGNSKGTDDKRVRHSDHTIVFNELFIERWLSDKDITLFHMNEVEGLHDSIGDNQKFKELYEHYEQVVPENHKKVIKASEYASLFFRERFLQGRLYYMFADNTNTQGMWKMPIKQSNLCVVPETEILTHLGYKKIIDLVGTKQTIWNGFEWSEKVEVFKTGENQQVIKVLTNYDVAIECTPYHKFYINVNGETVEKRANELISGDKIIPFSTYSYGRDTLVEISDMEIIEVVDEGRISDTYCFTEPKRNMGMFNGILAGNCLEITVPTKPLDLPDAEVGCCILSGINHGNVSDKRIPIVAEYLVRFLEEMIDYMDYSHKEIENPAKYRRTLGIGHSDIFHYLAKNKEFYNTLSGRNFLHRRMELATYHMTKASIEIAKEKGACEWFKDTKYSDGLFTIDLYNKNVDELITEPLHCDWEALRQDLMKYGMRHSTLTANAPFGNSAKPSNSTSGAEPPRFLATPKSDKKVKVIQLVPEYNKYKHYYTTAWGDDFNNIDYFKMLAVMQKFIDQSISANQYTNLLKYENNKVPLVELMQEFLTSKRYGLKTMYYQNFRTSDEVDGIEEEVGCASGGCVV